MNAPKSQRAASLEAKRRVYAYEYNKNSTL